MRYLLNVLYVLILFCGSPFVLYRMIRLGRYKRGLAAKLLGSIPNSGKSIPTIWIHAVSVGEVQLIRPIVERFSIRYPTLSVAISTSTDTGYDLARELFPEHSVFFAPLDFSWAVGSVFQKLNPKVLVLAELELWPNLIQQASRSKCPVAIINGRLSESSFRGYSRFPFLIRPVLSSLAWVGAQNETYENRFRQLGTPAERISVTGSIKFDNANANRSSPEIDDRRKLIGIRDSDVVWVAGSTQAPEEQLILDVFQELASAIPNLRLILVPRHKERFSEAAKLIESYEFKWDRRSRLSGTEEAKSDWRIFLGDSIGELRWWWGMADIAFVGGSFGNRGGQNMIEPCALGAATSFGPNTKNFRDIVALLVDEQACKQFQEPTEILPWVREMIEFPAKRKELGQKASQLVSQHKGALDRTWTHLTKLLPALPPDPK